MRIKIITIFNIPNFGSVFQAYALYAYLVNLGHDVELIDYQPDYFNKKSLRSIFGTILNLRAYITRKKKFKNFIKQNITLTHYCYHNDSDFHQFPIDADLFIAGGDQLWNTYHDCGNDDIYKLCFTERHKISYATSMGRCSFEKYELQDLASKISCFDHISVRESSSVELLHSVGLQAIQCADPVLLLTKEDYCKFIHKPTDEHYLLVYLVNPSDLLTKTVEYISSELNLQVIVCSGFSKKCKCDIHYKNLGPNEILSYLFYADFVLSASFHATVFSYLFQKQFATILPDENTNERIENFLLSNGMEAHLIKSTIDLDSKLFVNMEYKKSINELVIKSKEYLFNNLTSLIIE